MAGETVSTFFSQTKKKSIYIHITIITVVCVRKVLRYIIRLDRVKDIITKKTFEGICTDKQ